jgi:hypothetical protein
MDSESPEEYLQPRDNPDNASLFEIDLRTSQAKDSIVRLAHALTKQRGLDPSLAWDIEEAHRSGDAEEWDEALLRFVRALRDSQRRGG